MWGKRVPQLGRKQRVWDYKTREISKTKHVAISENSKRVVLRIFQRLLGTPRFSYQKR